jgi:hypothetical protein
MKMPTSELFGDFYFIKVIQHCFICRPSDSTVLEDAGIEPRIATTLALTARPSKHSARRSHTNFGTTVRKAE